jgi:hypothetical protein
VLRGGCPTTRARRPQGRGLQRLPGRLLSHPLSGQSPQFFLDQRQKLFVRQREPVYKVSLATPVFTRLTRFAWR